MMAARVPPDPRAFYAPQFQIKLKGQNIGREVIADVTEVTYTDGEKVLDSFEFSLGDWDPIERRPKYSSPWDANGKPYKIDGFDAPNFELGADVELYLSYMGEGDPVLMMKGEVVSVTPTFPAAGAPMCRVRALNYLYRLQREKVTGTFEGSKIDVARKIAEKVKVRVEMPPGAEMGEQSTDVVNNAVAYDEIAKRVHESYLVMRLEDAAGGPVLHFEAPAGSAPVATLTWGLNLVSFAPQLSTRRGVEKVEVYATDPMQGGVEQRPVGAASWSDLNVDTAALGPRGVDEVKKALSGAVEKIVDAEVKTEKAANERALNELKAIAKELVRANGSSIGMPELRAGRVIEIAGLGPRFSGLYQLTQTTHTVGASGYTVSFQCYKLVLKS